MYSDIARWSVEDLVDAVKKEPVKKEKVKIPEYQRNLVWSDDQKKSFIESIKKGFPFGSLLLFKQGSDADGYTNYSLTDGLQRTTTIMKYIDNPNEFFEKENIEETFINNVIETLEIENEIREELIKIIVEWIKGLNGFKESDGYSSHNLANEIRNKLNLSLTFEKFDELYKIIIPFKERIESDADISQAKIPILIYSGDESNLPTIFERINSRGTKLNKYQIYAAVWSDKKTRIINTDIIDHIKAKYDALINEGLTIENYEPNKEDFYRSEFSMFEYLFGFGKYLSEKYSSLFGISGEEDTTESIAFNLCTMCLLNDLKEMSALPTKMMEVDQETFQKALIDSIDITFSTLKPFITLKANKQTSRPNSKAVIYHTEYQIVSLIAKVYKSKYNQDLSIRNTWNTIEPKLKKNIPFFYLYDILREFWRGSGDSKIKEYVKDGSRYESSLSRENWENVLNEWFTYHLLRNEKTRVTIRDVDILFLKYIYTHILSSYQDLSSTEFEIEHLVPVARLKSIAVDQGLPISAISNLCLIEKEINRDKKELTIYEYFGNLVKDGTYTEEQVQLEIEKTEKYTFTTIEDLSFITNLNKENYKEMLINRFEKLKEIFYEKNNI